MLANEVDMLGELSDRALRMRRLNEADTGVRAWLACVPTSEDEVFSNEDWAYLFALLVGADAGAQLRRALPRRCVRCNRFSSAGHERCCARISAIPRHEALKAALAQLLRHTDAGALVTLERCSPGSGRMDICVRNRRTRRLLADAGVDPDGEVAVELAASLNIDVTVVRHDGLAEPREGGSGDAALRRAEAVKRAAECGQSARSRVLFVPAAFSDAGHSGPAARRLLHDLLEGVTPAHARWWRRRIAGVIMRGTLEMRRRFIGRTAGAVPVLGPLPEGLCGLMGG